MTIVRFISFLFYCLNNKKSSLFLVDNIFCGSNLGSRKSDLIKKETMPVVKPTMVVKNYTRSIQNYI